jgi:hypothetical protein
MRRVPLYRWLAAVPALLILVGVPFANRVHPQVFGIPFLLFWIVACVVLTSVVLALIARLDAKFAPPAKVESLVPEPDDPPAAP